MFSTNKKIQRFTERHHKEANFGELLERYQAMLVQIDEPMLARVAIQQLLERDSSLDIHKPLNLATIQETAGLTLSGPSETITSMDLIDRHPDPVKLLQNLNHNACAALINHHFSWLVWQSLPPVAACSGASTTSVKPLGDAMQMTYTPKNAPTYS